MKSRFVSLFAVVCCVFVCVGGPSSAPAANINANTTQCNALDPAQIDLVLHDAIGVRTAPSVDAPLLVICPVPRSPLTAQATGGFYVDGDNQSGASTMCWLESFDYTGIWLADAAFTTTEARYDRYLGMPTAALTTWAYLSLQCYLPPHGQGVLRGVTSMQ